MFACSRYRTFWLVWIHIIIEEKNGKRGPLMALDPLLFLPVSLSDNVCSRSLPALSVQAAEQSFWDLDG